MENIFSFSLNKKKKKLSSKKNKNWNYKGVWCVHKIFKVNTI